MSPSPRIFSNRFSDLEQKWFMLLESLMNTFFFRDHFFETKFGHFFILHFQNVALGTLEKPMVHLLKQLLTPSAAVEAAFQRIAKIDALHSLHDGLKLFLHHFVLGRKKKDNAAYNLIQERVKLID